MQKWHHGIVLHSLQWDFLLRIFFLSLVLPPLSGIINLCWVNINLVIMVIMVSQYVITFPPFNIIFPPKNMFHLNTILWAMRKQILGHKQLSREDKEMSALNICVALVESISWCCHWLTEIMCHCSELNHFSPPTLVCQDGWISQVARWEVIRNKITIKKYFFQSRHFGLLWQEVHRCKQ